MRAAVVLAALRAIGFDFSEFSNPFVLRKLSNP